MATGHVEKRSKKGWTLVIDYGRYVDPVTKKEKQRREYRAIKNCTKAEALAQLHDMLAAINRGTYVKASPVALADYLRRWYADRCVPRLSPTTLENYGICIEKHLIPKLGDKRLGELAPMDLEGLYADMRREGAHPRTIEQVHQVLHIALARAVKLRVVPQNVADLVEPPRPADRTPPILSPRDMETILTAAPSPLREMATLALHTGLRRGEVLGLRWEDVDPDGGWLRVERSLLRMGGKWISKPPKSKHGRRLVPLDTEVAAMLRAMPRRGETVFCREDGQPFSPDWLSHAFLTLTRKLGYTLRFHDLRHAYITSGALAGVDVRTMRELAGHGDITTTVSVYTHIPEEAKREAADAIGRYLETGKRQLSDGPRGAEEGNTGRELVGLPRFERGTS